MNQSKKWRIEKKYAGKKLNIFLSWKEQISVKGEKYLKILKWIIYGPKINRY